MSALNWALYILLSSTSGFLTYVFPCAQGILFPFMHNTCLFNFMFKFTRSFVMFLLADLLWILSLILHIVILCSRYSLIQILAGIGVITDFICINISSGVHQLFYITYIFVCCLIYLPRIPCSFMRCTQRTLTTWKHNFIVLLIILNLEMYEVKYKKLSHKKWVPFVSL
jgi:hypothetical protein